MRHGHVPAGDHAAVKSPAEGRLGCSEFAAKIDSEQRVGPAKQRAWSSEPRKAERCPLHPASL